MVPKRLSGVLEAFASRARSCVELHSGGACSPRHGLFWAGYKTSITEPCSTSLTLCLTINLTCVIAIVIIRYYFHCYCNCQYYYDEYDFSCYYY